MSYSGTEKRGAPRVQMATSARAWVDNQEITLQLVNLSALGILAIPGRALAVGSVLLLELSLPEHEAFHVAAEVVREDTVNGHYAVGLRLRDLPEDHQRLLGDFVTRTRKKTRPHEVVTR